ncbi:hypothetical protein BGX34_000960 [Mortierella sp. NVP85]|nr:hypothetical protein BGX34_000960 [Mortierella sp. NVP85]
MDSVPSGSPTSNTDRPLVKALQLAELLEHIALFLADSRSDIKRAGLVCKAWLPIFTARLWHTLDLPPHNRQTAIIALLPRYGCHIRSLTLVGQFDQDTFFKSCRNLTLLDLTLASLNVESLSNMVKCLPYLQVLRFNACYGMGLAWFSPLKGLEYLQELTFMNDADNYHDKTTLDMNMLDMDMDTLDTDNLDIDNQDMGDQGSSELPEGDEDLNAPSPDIVFASQDDEMDEETYMDHLKPDYLGEFLVARASTLRKLVFEGSDVLGLKLFEAYDLPMDDTEVERPSSLVDERPPVLALRHINFSKTSVYRTTLVIEPLLRQCPDLEVLDISGCIEESWINFEWSILSQSCLKLTTLNVSGFIELDNDQLVQVVRACLGLRVLIASQSNIASKVLDAIVDKWIGGQNPFLELDVSWCAEVDQESLEKVVHNITTLKRLNFSWCQIDTSIFQQPWCCLELEGLEAQGLDPPPLCNSEDVEWAVFKQLSRLRHLRRLVLGSDEMRVSKDRGFGLLLADEGTGQCGLSHLEYLELVGHEDLPFGQAEMEVIADGFPRLKRFHFGLNLVPQQMQNWLAERRPDIQQEENVVYH